MTDKKLNSVFINFRNDDIYDRKNLRHVCKIQDNDIDELIKEDIIYESGRTYFNEPRYMLTEKGIELKKDILSKKVEG